MDEEEILCYNAPKEIRNIFEEFDQQDQNVLNWLPFENQLDCFHWNCLMIFNIDIGLHNWIY